MRSWTTRSRSANLKAERFYLRDVSVKLMVQQLDETALSIFVDGSSYSNPRSGGVGIRFVWADKDGDEQIEEEALPFSYEGGRNNQMELQAPIQALETVLSRYAPVDLDGFRKIDIYSDSQYLVDNFQNMKYRWPTTQWLGQDERPIANLVLWKKLRKLVDRLYQKHRITVRVEWIPGKKGEHAKRVDRLAKESAQTPVKRKLEHERPRRKWSPNSVEIGCVRLHGQVEVVRLINDKVARRGLYVSRYEIVDDESPDYQLVDEVFSEHVLSSGHVYIVRFNDNTKNPRIEEVLAEVTDAEGGLPTKLNVKNLMRSAREQLADDS
jgi:ribonuclease HI